MSALKELTTTGVVGPETVDLLTRLVGQSGRTSSFPPPLGHPAWSDQAVIDYVGNIMMSERGKGMAVSCALLATDDPSLERLLLTSIRRFMIDEAKATPVGRLRRRLRTLLKKDDRFLAANQLLAGEEAWTIHANGKNVWTEDITKLEQLTASVQVAPIERLTRSGPTPPAAKESLLTLSHEALTRAAGAMRAQLLARFLHRRFDLDGLPLSSNAHAADDATVLTLGPSDEVSILARTIFDHISHDDVTILRSFSADVDSLKADPARDDLFQRLRVYSGSEVGRDAVNLVVRWCASINELVS